MTYFVLQFTHKNKRVFEGCVVFDDVRNIFIRPTTLKRAIRWKTFDIATQYLNRFSRYNKWEDPKILAVHDDALDIIGFLAYARKT